MKRKFHFGMFMPFVLLLQSCGGLLTNEKSTSNCMYFDFKTGTIVSTCGTNSIANEKIISIRVNTDASENINFNTTLLDSSFATPVNVFKTTLNATALSKIKAKGISIIAYTQRSGYWYSLRAGPGELATKGRIYFTINN